MSLNLQGIKCGDNDYMILRLIELAENLGLDTNLINKEEYYNIAKKYRLPSYK